MRALFIHRSVGHHLIQHGNLRELLSAKDIALDDYDNNTGLLTTSDGVAEKSTFEMPGNNTNPENLSEFFRNWHESLQNYDLVMVKSCYPNSHIKDKTQLTKIKGHYATIIDSFSQHDMPLLILTSPPLRPLFTNGAEAKLAAELADWLNGQTKNQVRIFDFHNLLAESGGKHVGMLKRSYRRLAPWDNHPNNAAHKNIAPQLVEFIV
jgi:hypothetical protein